MEFQTLKKNHKKEIIIGAVIISLLIITIIFTTTRAKYQTAESINIAKGTINYKPYDFKIMAMYQQENNGNYKEVNTMPSSGYIINESKSYCTKDNVNKDNNAILKTVNGEHVIKNLTKSDKCYLYFDRPTSVSTILQTLNKSARPNYQTLTENTTGTIFTEQDDDGLTYYYAGAVDNNWVKFAGFYWRIIRFNGDGTIRLIYNGTTADQTGEGTQIGKSAFNEQNNDNAYVGYMYGTPGSDTYEASHANTNSSIIKSVIDTWYKTNIVDKGFSAKVDTNAGFCGDREPSTSDVLSNGLGGTGTTLTYYGAFIRFRKGNTNLSNPTPTLKCPDKANDLYTVSSANKGNKSLTYPVGLISVDEVSAAGAILGMENSIYYLYTGETYWTMSPYNSDTAGYTHAFNMDNYGQIGWNNLTGTSGVRPVINLKADTTFATGGDGTASNPYVVQ